MLLPKSVVDRVDVSITKSENTRIAEIIAKILIIAFFTVNIQYISITTIQVNNPVLDADKVAIYSVIDINTILITGFVAYLFELSSVVI